MHMEATSTESVKTKMCLGYLYRLHHPGNYRMKKVKIANPEISTFKQKLYERLYNEYKQKFHLKDSVVFLGDLKHFKNKAFLPSKKMLYYISKLKREEAKCINKSDSLVSNVDTKEVEIIVRKKPITKGNFIIFDDSTNEDSSVTKSFLNITSSEWKNASLSISPNTLPVENQNIKLNTVKETDVCVDHIDPITLTTIETPKNRDSSSNRVLPDECLNVFGNEIKRTVHKCTLCSQTFNDSIQLKRHMMIHKLKKDEVQVKKQFSCYICMAKFLERTQLWAHIKIHSNKAANFKCIACNMGFKSKSAFNSHSLKCSSIEQVDFKCSHCTQQFKTAQALHTHEIHCKPSESVLLDSNILPNNERNCKTLDSTSVSNSLLQGKTTDTLLVDLENKLKYRCSICKKKFGDIYQMRKHKRSHTKKDLCAVDKVSSKNNFRKIVLIDDVSVNRKISLQSSSTKFVRLEDNGINSTSKSKVQQKSKIVPALQTPAIQTTKKNKEGIFEDHNLKPKFKCCKNVFEERTDLFIHMKLQIDKGYTDCNPMYACKICNADFAVRFDWYTHCKSKHPGLFKRNRSKPLIIRKPRFNCKKCYMKFDSTLKLKSHVCTTYCLLSFDKTKMCREKKNSKMDKKCGLQVEFENSFASGKDTQYFNIPSDSSSSCMQVDNLLEEPLANACNESRRKQSEPSTELKNVTYRCDICYDVFMEETELAEHEAFHEEILLPKNKNNPSTQLEFVSEIASGRKRNMPTLCNDATNQKHKTSVNHINSVVNLPCVLNQNDINAKPQQNLLRVLSKSQDSCSPPPLCISSLTDLVYVKDDFFQQNKKVACKTLKSVFSRGPPQQSSNDQSGNENSIECAPEIITCPKALKRKQNFMNIYKKQKSLKKGSKVSNLLLKTSYLHDHEKNIQISANNASIKQDCNLNVNQKELQSIGQTNHSVDNDDQCTFMYINYVPGARSNISEQVGNSAGNKIVTDQLQSTKSSVNFTPSTFCIQKKTSEDVRVSRSSNVSSSGNVVDIPLSTSKANLDSAKSPFNYFTSVHTNVPSEYNLTNTDPIVLSDDSNDNVLSICLSPTENSLKEVLPHPDEVVAVLNESSIKILGTNPSSRQLSKEVEEAEIAVSSIIEKLKSNDVSLEHNTVLAQKLSYDKDVLELNKFNINDSGEKQIVHKSSTTHRPRILIRNITELTENKNLNMSEFHGRSNESNTMLHNSSFSNIHSRHPQQNDNGSVTCTSTRNVTESAYGNNERRYMK